MAAKKGPTDNQRIEFAKQVEYMYEASQPSWKRVFGFSFVKGIATGLGVFVGGTIVVGLLLWILSGLSQVPFLTKVTNSVRHTLQQGGN